MPEQLQLKEENLIIIKEIEVRPAVTQRELSVKLAISLGKINYLLKELIKKGLIEVRSFSENSGKLNKIRYYLTKEGLEYKIQATGYFLKAKEAEYNQMKQEWERLVFNEEGIVVKEEAIK